MDRSTDQVVIPFYVDNHWLLIFLRLNYSKESKTAQIFDSLAYKTDENMARASRCAAGLRTSAEGA